MQFMQNLAGFADIERNYSAASDRRLEDRSADQQHHRCFALLSLASI